MWHNARTALLSGVVALLATLTTVSSTHGHGLHSHAKCDNCDHCVRIVRRCRPLRSIICSIRERIHSTHCPPTMYVHSANGATQKDMSPVQKHESPVQKSPVQKITPTQKHDHGPIQK